MTNTAAMYLRISVDSTGRAEGVQGQQDDCSRVVAARGWELVGTYTDNDISAAGKKVRPDFDTMVEAIEQGKVNVVVSQRWDRLSRNRRDDLRLLEACEKHGVLLSFSRGGDLDMSTPMGSQFADMLSSQARSEIRIKGDRQRIAQRRRADAGKPAKGVRLTGYTINGEVVDDEAKIVRRIFDRFASGDTLKGIAADLHADGIQTRRGGQWSSSSVSSILQNARYAGRSVYKGTDVGAATWPAIVSEAQFAAVQARLDDPRRKTRGEGTDRKHLGSGLYFCSCGLRIKSSSGMGSGGLNRYTCRHTHFYRSARPVDDFVLAIIRGRLARPDLRELLVKPLDESEMAALTAERRELRHRLVRFEADYDAGLIDGRRLKTATDKAGARLAEIRAQEVKLIAQTGPGSVLGADDPAAAFDAAPLPIRQQLIDTLATITLHKGKHGSRVFDPDSVTLAWK